MLHLLHFIKYFFFLSINHSPLLACRILYDELKGEYKYKLHTTDIKTMKRLKNTGAVAAASKEYMPSNYILLEKTFTELNKHTHNKTFLDIGCGKGRTLFVAASFGFEKITGIEFFMPYCRQVQQQFPAMKKRFPAASFAVICTDAAQYAIPDTVQTILFNNPFNEKVMRQVVQQIQKSLARAKRELFIIYISPVDKQQLITAGFEELSLIRRFNYIEASVLHYPKQRATTAAVAL